VISAEWAASGLLGEQAQVVAVQRGFDPSSSAGPVVDQLGIVRRRRTGNQLVPDNGSPGEFDQMWDTSTLICTSAIPEHPLIIPGLYEPAEVTVDNPLLRLSRVAAFGPPPGELPQVIVQLTKGFAGHHSPIVGSPPPDDRGERGDNRRRVRAAQRAHLVGEPFSESLDGHVTWLDQQLAVSVTADIEPQKIEPFGQVDDLGLVLIEGKTPGCQPFGEPCFDPFSLFPGVSADDQVISVSNQDRGVRLCVPSVAAGDVVPNSRGLFQPMKRHIHHQRTDHTPLRSSLLGRGEHPVFDHPGFEPSRDHVPGGE
jgi:hypothetical protein